MAILDAKNLNPDELKMLEALSRQQAAPQPIAVPVIVAENPDGTHCRIYQNSICIEEELGNKQVAFYMTNGMVLQLQAEPNKLICQGVYPSVKDFLDRPAQ